MNLPLWVEFFQDLQLIRGRAKNTIEAYRRDLEIYLEFKLTKKPISTFYDYLKSHGLSVRSQARVISSVRTYLRFCQTQGVKVPEIQELRPPKVKVGLPKSFSLEDFEKLLSACRVDDVNKTHRNQLTLFLLFGLGCRVSELIKINLSDYNPTDRWIKIFGKGSKERLVPVSDMLAEILSGYLQKHRPQLIARNASDFLLVNDRGHRPSRVDIWRWLAAWSAKAGYGEPVNPHRFRHACATSLLEGGADLRSIQMLLGHSSIQTTQVYTHVTSQNLRDTIDQHHPLSSDPIHPVLD